MPSKELELYLHIPFCVRKCDYCDFLSMPANEELRRHYVDCLMEEIKQKAALCREYLCFLAAERHLFFLACRSGNLWKPCEGILRFMRMQK